MPLQIFPLTGGMQQGFDVRLLPDGVLANAVNCELERVGRVVGRAKYTAIASTVYGSGTFVGYDLFSVDDRLFALGDRNSTGYPTDIFSYVTDAAAAWAPTDRSRAAHRLPRATRLREIARPPDASGGVSNFSVAATAGFVLLLYNNDDPDGVTNGYAHLVKASGDQTLFFDELAAVEQLSLKAIALSDRFLIFALNTATTVLRIHRCIPTSDEGIAIQLATAYTGLGAISVFEACKVTGSDQVVVVANCAGTVIVRRFNSTGTLQVPSGGAYANITAAATRIAVEASSTDNQITVALVIAGATKLYSYNLSTGASIQTAVSLVGGTQTEVSLVRVAADSVEAFVSMDDVSPEDSITYVRWTPSSGAFGTQQRIPDVKLQSTVVFQGDEFVMGCRNGSTDPVIGTNVLLSAANELTSPVGGGGAAYTQLLAVKDLETASPPGARLPEIVRDASTGKYYWANAVINPDQDGSPVVTEFSLGAAERRQVALFGNHVYIAGGLPCVFDQRYLCESGFTERPRIVSLTGGASGSLLAGATYNYRLHEEQVDSQGDIHLSPPSVIVPVTLTAGQTKVTAVVSTGHGLRRNAPVAFEGISVRHVLSRTLATVTNTAAVIIGERSIDPPDSTLSTLTLVVKAGGTTWTVTFTVAATTAAQIVIEINATVNTLKLLASAPNGVLVLTSVATGDTASVQVISGTALTLLGLTAGDLAQGETDRSVGENFQRAATAYNPTADIPGEFISIVDTRKDESDPIVDADLIRQQVLYSQGIASGAHHAPPPSDCVWAGKERVGFFRQHKRSRWTVSKIVVPGEPVECAAEGFLQFSGQVSGDIEAGAFVGGALVLWTRKQIWLVTGEGPRRNGVGEFNQAECITRSIGMIADGWMSQVQDDEGVWFQGSDGELYRISNGGQLEWLGKPVREYLQTYPKIVGAVYRQSKREVAFAVTTANGSSGGILRRNALVPDSPGWFFDDVGAVSSIAEYQGRLCYVQAGIVYLQDASPGSGAFPTMQLDSGLFQGFQALGYGALQELGVLATFRGRCTITLKIGTDGVTFPDTIAAWSLTASEYAVGQRVQLLIDAPKQEFDSFAIRAEVSDVTGTTEGAWLHAFAVKTESKPDFVRLAPSRRL